MLGGESAHSKIPKVSIQINETPLDIIVDTGASSDILDETTFASLNKEGDIQLQPPSKHLCAYGSGQQLPVLGKFPANLSFKGNCITSMIHVLEGNHGSLLCFKSATELGIIEMHVNHVAPMLTVHEELCRVHPEFFWGIGNLKGVDSEIKLYINPSASAVAQPARQIPFHLQKKVE